ncbi:leucine-rich repeat domain-containing protein [Clostridiaceae bacterium]|nr:leucine-rich repeat domain-containing protein [Clostridiaceae bacterium]RKI18285.1 leucine-rich repeat domain-containing protein [bacterium 1XD21-70]
MNHHFHIQDDILLRYEGKEESVIVPEGIRTIGEGAFKACVSLKEVTLPPGLSRILAGAFKGCRKLEKIEIPQGASEIGDYAFHRCHCLREAVLPASVSRLGDCAFLYCDSLTKIRMPGVRRLGRQAFVNDVLLEELEISRELCEEDLCDVFTGCGRISRIAFADGEEFSFPNVVEVVAGKREVPPLIRAVAVDVLRMMELDGRQLVRFLTNLKHVEIPEGITSIKKSCFFDKRGILSLHLPASLRVIESRAFRNCIGLETVVFQHNDVQIQEDAFQNCTALKHVTVCGQTKYTFQGITGLAGHNAPPLVQAIYRQVMGNFRVSGTILLKYLGSESRVVVPQGITVIGEEAFAGNEAIDRVILPGSLEEIGAGAFRDCLVLQAVEFPAQLNFIGPGAFENCVKLIRAALPGGITAVEPGTFKHCRILRELSFSSCLKEIGEMAFYGCLSLKQVDFPQSLETVRKMAFYRCAGLKEVHLPPSLRHVGSLAFAESGLIKASVAGDGRDFGTGIFSYCPRLRTLVMEPGVRHIPHKLAFGCGKLAHVHLPETLKAVGRHALEGTPFLEKWKQERMQSALLPAGEPNGCGMGTDPMEEVFWDGSGLCGEVRLAKTVRLVAGGAFYGNDALTQIHFPETVTWVGAAALKGCRLLSMVSWPSGIDEIEEETFSGCVSLKAVLTCLPRQNQSPSNCKKTDDPSLPDAFPAVIRSAGTRAFYCCSSLEQIHIGGMVSAGKEAFRDCASLCRQPLKSLLSVGEGAWEGTCYTALLPNQGMDASLPVLNHILLSGQGYIGEACLPQGIRSIAPYAFAGNCGLTKVTFPDTLVHIGEGAFWGCTGLQEVEFSHTACQIGQRAFEKCASLRELKVYASQAKSRAFACCPSLTQAELYGLFCLEERLFENCSSLEDCLCPQAESVQDFCFCGCRNLRAFDSSRISHIGSYAFQDCDHLRSVDLADGAVLMPHAFEACGRLEAVRLGGTKKAPLLREYAFCGCTALRTVSWQEKTWQLRAYPDILSDGLPQAARQVFASALSCFVVEKEDILTGYQGQGRIVHIPRGIRQIGAEVFRDILMLEEVEIPDTVALIGARAFHGTAWLEKQRRKSPLVTINHMVLDGSCCAGEVVIPEDIRLVCGWAFAGGLDIRRIRFLSDKVKVGEYAFRNCINLEEMVLADGTAIQFGGIADRKREFLPVAKQAVMDRLNCFKTDDADALAECTGNIPRLVLAEGITAIKDHVFQDANLLTMVRLPCSVASIGACGFAGCKWLRRVEHGVNVKRIGDMAFSGCSRLEAVELSEKLRFIGVRAFENCTSLKEIYIPEGVAEIPERAFFRCHSLEQVTLPSTLQRIGREAFAFCKNLRQPLVRNGVFVGERAFAGLWEPGGSGSL